MQCAAGSYDFEADRGVVTLRSTDPKVAASAMIVITRLGRHDKDTGTELIFDKVGDKFMLSEIWMPNQDGFLVLNTPVDHEHRVLGGSNPRK